MDSKYQYPAYLHYVYEITYLQDFLKVKSFFGWLDYMYIY